MPRKRNNGGKRRESHGNRRKRDRAAKARYQALGVDPSKRIHQRIELDSAEFTYVFRLQGGIKCVGSKTVRVFDADGRKVPITERRIVAAGSLEEELLETKRDGKELDAADRKLIKHAVWENGRFVIEVPSGIVPKVLGMDRGKVAILASSWADVEAIAEARERLREVKKQNQVAAILDATDRHSFGWYRQEVPDQAMRSILTGSNNGRDPTIESSSLVVCYREDDGRYYLAEERWDGGWSPADKDGHRERVGVHVDRLPIAFYDEKEAQHAFMLAAESGKLSRFQNRESYARKQSMATRLRAWEHRENFAEDGAFVPGEARDMKRLYSRRPPEKKKKPLGETELEINEVRAENGLPPAHEEPKPRGKRVRIPNAG